MVAHMYQGGTLVDPRRTLEGQESITKSVW
jgi:hypothetical protein